MIRRGRRPGVTLVETLIAGSMALVVMAMVFSVFFPAQSFFQQANEISTMYGDALSALDRISVEIEEAGPWIVNATDSNPPALALPSARDATNTFRRKSTGTPDWQKWILWYVAAQGTDLVLVRKEMAGTFPPSPLPWTIPLSALGAPDASSRIMVRNLSLFRVETAAGPSGGTRCLVELVISRPGAQGTHTQRFERAAVSRNAQ